MHKYMYYAIALRRTKMSKRGLAKKSVFLQNIFLKKYNAKLDLVMNGELITQYMAYDVINHSLQEKYSVYHDYTRYRTFELLADEIRAQYIDEDLSQFCVAEAGVFLGEFAWIINERFPECNIYLYDTFEGFDKNDLAEEIDNFYTKDENLTHYKELFGGAELSAENRIEIVKGRMPHTDKCVFRKGYFPETAVNEKEKRWLFVSLDMDLYVPIKEGLKFFWPNMVNGGYIFVHDYNNKDFAGIRKAIIEIEKEFGTIKKVPLSDQGGTIILCK